jgi:hypothetical protein
MNLEEQQQTTVTVPGPYFALGLRSNAPASSESPATVASTQVDFKKVEHLLSKKPLRRPNRTRPAD